MRHLGVEDFALKRAIAIRRREASASLRRHLYRLPQPREQRYQTPRGVCFFEANFWNIRKSRTYNYQTPRGVCFFEARPPPRCLYPCKTYQTPRGVCFFEACVAPSAANAAARAIRRREASASLRHAYGVNDNLARYGYQTPRGVCFFEAHTPTAQTPATRRYQTPRGVCFFEARAVRRTRGARHPPIRRREASASLRHADGRLGRVSPASIRRREASASLRRVGGDVPLIYRTSIRRREASASLRRLLAPQPAPRAVGLSDAERRLLL